jgi:hypothetical protein
MPNDEFLPQIDVIGEQNTNLNSIQIEQARSFLSSVYGNYCGAGCDLRTGCGKNVQQLETLWQAGFIQKNQPIPKRVAPFLIVNEKKGRGLHRLVNGKRDDFGNVNYFCKSCNMIYDRRSGDIQVFEKATFQARKSHEIRPKFKNELAEFLKENTHGCFNEIMNKWSDEYKCSQELLKQAYDQIYDIVIDEIQTVDYDIRCKYGKCNGTHIIIKGEPPVINLSKQDLNAFLDEMKERHKDDEFAKSDKDVNDLK